MKRLLVLAGGALLLAGAAPQARAQLAATPQQHSHDVASAFSKVKDKVKDKGGVHTEVHLAVSSQPWLAPTPAAYAGTYAVEGLGFVLKVAATPTGELRLSGEEPAADGLGHPQPVAFSNARVQDGWLTATKTDAHGHAQPFAGAFLTQTRNGVAAQGFGTKLAKPVELNGLMLEKLFYQKQP